MKTNQIQRACRTRVRNKASQSVKAGETQRVNEKTGTAAERQEMILFYCLDCTRSFRVKGREDLECLEKWHYHSWYANCPYCGTEVRQTDNYWR